MSNWIIGIAGGLALALASAGAGTGTAWACVEGDLRGDRVVAEREFDAVPAGDSANFHLLGAGWFSALEVVKRGGISDSTSVTLEIDGVPVFSTSFAALKNPWMQLSTNFIIANVKTEGDVSTMTIWYRPELKFRAMLGFRVDVSEDGVDGLRMRTVMNKPAPHEHPPGQPSSVASLPVFK